MKQISCENFHVNRDWLSSFGRIFQKDELGILFPVHFQLRFTQVYRFVFQRKDMPAIPYLWRLIKYICYKVSLGFCNLQCSNWSEFGFEIFMFKTSPLKVKSQFFLRVLRYFV